MFVFRGCMTVLDRFGAGCELVSEFFGILRKICLLCCELLGRLFWVMIGVFGLGGGRLGLL